MESNKIGEFIQVLRKEKNLTQEQLGNKLSYGKATISQWEKGGSIPNPVDGKKLCRIFNITLDELYEGEYKKSFISVSKFEQAVKKGVRAIKEIEMTGIDIKTATDEYGKPLLYYIIQNMNVDNLKYACDKNLFSGYDYDRIIKALFLRGIKNDSKDNFIFFLSHIFDDANFYNTYISSEEKKILLEKYLAEKKVNMDINQELTEEEKENIIYLYIEAVFQKKRYSEKNTEKVFPSLFFFFLNLYTLRERYNNELKQFIYANMIFGDCTLVFIHLLEMMFTNKQTKDLSHDLNLAIEKSLDKMNIINLYVKKVDKEVNQLIDEIGQNAQSARNALELIIVKKLYSKIDYYIKHLNDNGIKVNIPISKIIILLEDNKQDILLKIKDYINVNCDINLIKHEKYYENIYEKEWISSQFKSYTHTQKELDYRKDLKERYNNAMKPHPDFLKNMQTLSYVFRIIDILKNNLSLDEDFFEYAYQANDEAQKYDDELCKKYIKDYNEFIMSNAKLFPKKIIINIVNELSGMAKEKTEKRYIRYSAGTITKIEKVNESLKKDNAQKLLQLYHQGIDLDINALKLILKYFLNELDQKEINEIHTLLLIKMEKEINHFMKEYEIKRSYDYDE